MAIITLLTDFGLADEYVGVMKGAILAVNPAAVIVDICHHIPPQDVGAAGRMLAASFAVFPAGSIHVAVVDPGVGSSRAIVALQAGGHFFIAPDNGLIAWVVQRHRPEQLVRIHNQRWFRLPLSQTFHGRDIFAPVAGHLSLGVGLSQFGPAFGQEDLVVLAQPDQPQSGVGHLAGEVSDVDRFGNLITTVDGRHLSDFQRRDPTATLCITIGSVRIMGLASAYADVAVGEWVALVGSRGLLEVAVNGGSAAQRLGCGRGAGVTITLA